MLHSFSKGHYLEVLRAPEAPPSAVPALLQRHLHQPLTSDASFPFLLQVHDAAVQQACSWL
jgi:hypothetical protein